MDALKSPSGRKASRRTLAEEAEIVADYMTREADARAFYEYPAWIDTSLISAGFGDRAVPPQSRFDSFEAFLGHVERMLERHGVWSFYDELRMGAGRAGEVALIEVGGERRYRVSAGDRLRITADYRTLRRALDMVHLFATVEWDMTFNAMGRDDSWLGPGPPD